MSLKLRKLLPIVCLHSQVCSPGLDRPQTNTTEFGTPHRTTRYDEMENPMFRNLSVIDVCRRMSAICQKSADESLPGIGQARLQMASDKFRSEADVLTLAHLQQSSHWHLHCSTLKTADVGALGLARRIKRSGLKLVRGSPSFCRQPRQ